MHDPGLADAQQGHDDRRGREGVDQRHDAGDAPNRPVEAELAEECHPRQRFGRKFAGGHEQGHGDGEVEAGAALPDDAGRGQVDGHPFERPRPPARQEGSPDAVARLAAGGVGQAHDVEAGQPG